MDGKQNLAYVFSIIKPHIFEDRGPFRSLNRLFRRQFKRINIERYGYLRFLLKRSSLPYIRPENTRIERVLLELDYLLRLAPHSAQTDRPLPYRYDTPIVVIRHANIDYVVDGHKRLRYFRLSGQRKMVDVLLVCVSDDGFQLLSFLMHTGDRIGQNLPSWLAMTPRSFDSM